MRISLITFGTEGDTRPIIALAKGLLDAGHDVHLLTEASSLPLAHSLQIPADALAGDMKQAVSVGGELYNLIHKGGQASDLARACAKLAEKHTADWMCSLIQSAKESEIIIFSGLTPYVALSVAEYLDIPAIGAGLWPFTPTKAFASAILPPNKIPAWLNKSSQVLVGAIMWRMFKSSINKARKTVCNQPPRYKMWAGYPSVYGVSKYLVPRPDDWPDNHQISGAWQITESGYTPPEDLAEFLNAGDAPIYIGFGSMAGFNQNTLLPALIEAFEGQRVLFAAGWSTPEIRLPENFFALKHCPHDWLFPQTSLIVHHGGAGTTHAAAASGIPSIVIPFAGDQFFWADRLYKTGVTPQYVPGTKINAEHLRTMIQFTTQHTVKEKAQQLGDLIRKEEGVKQAVLMIESWRR